jgi:hypothetical protein
LLHVRWERAWPAICFFPERGRHAGRLHASCVLLSLRGKRRSSTGHVQAGHDAERALAALCTCMRCRTVLSGRGCSSYRCSWRVAEATKQSQLARGWPNSRTEKNSTALLPCCCLLFLRSTLGSELVHGILSSSACYEICASAPARPPLFCASCAVPYPSFRLISPGWTPRCVDAGCSM